MSRQRYIQTITLTALTPLFVGVPVLWTVGYLVWLFAMMVIVIPLFICRHCPHWDNVGWYLTCDAHWGVPKIYAASDKPLNGIQRFCVYAGFVVIFGLPVGLLIANESYALAIVAAVLGVQWYVLMRTAVCSTCWNYRCPLASQYGSEV